jgi:hypothetical protein
LSGQGAVKLVEIGFYLGSQRTRRTLPVYDVLRRELWPRKLDAPFRKLVVKNANSREQERVLYTAPIEGIMEVAVHVPEHVLEQPFDSMKDTVLDAAVRGVSLTARALRWPDAQVQTVLQEVRARDPFHHYEVKSVSRVHRATRSRARVFFSLTDVDCSLSVAVERRGVLAQEVVLARDAPPNILEVWKGAISSELDGSAFVLRDGKGDEIGRVDVREAPEEGR